MADPREQIEKVRDQFTKQADAYIRSAQATNEAGLRGLVTLSGAQPGHSALDVACGPGFLTMAFAARCASAVGFDATDVFLERARREAARRAIPNIEFRAGDAEQLPFADASFDVVACRAAFHHFARPARVLAEMVRVLKADGRILVADLVASEDAAKAAYQDRIERLCDPSHARALPESELARILAQEDLELVARPRSTLHYSVEEWLDHGGPNEAATREILALFEATLDEDRSGLAVRREEGVLRFSHTAVAFVARRAPRQG
jgi:ubiquinone/menaquinone biosynthesis C-methylase UbiE